MRAAALRAIRAFFDAADFVEVDTPVRIPVPALEPYIDAMPADGWFLRTSPEFHMKRLLAAGLPRIWQVGPCFRAGESGRFHNPEFTMLEWYRAPGTYHDLLDDTRHLMDAIVAAMGPGRLVGPDGTLVDMRAPWELCSVGETFKAIAGWDPHRAFDPDRFDMDLVNLIEPALPRDRPVVLFDYPVPAAGLAACRGEDDPPVAERWELYVGGVEIANACTELTDAAELRRRFAAWGAIRRSRGVAPYPVDAGLLDAMEAGLPACSGIALGLERLLMLLAGAASIACVRLFATSPATSAERD